MRSNHQLDSKILRDLYRYTLSLFKFNMICIMFSKVHIIFSDKQRVNNKTLLQILISGRDHVIHSFRFFAMNLFPILAPEGHRNTKCLSSSLIKHLQITKSQQLCNFRQCIDLQTGYRYTILRKCITKLPRHYKNARNTDYISDNSHSK